jgi:hypothetical protein
MELSLMVNASVLITFVLAVTAFYGVLASRQGAYSSHGANA